MALGFEDPRVSVHITDGIDWVMKTEEGTYDAIIVDSSDPVGPAEVLFEKVSPGLPRFERPKRCSVWDSLQCVVPLAQRCVVL